MRLVRLGDGEDSVVPERHDKWKIRRFLGESGLIVEVHANRRK